jgi:hypothetical protein
MPTPHIDLRLRRLALPLATLVLIAAPTGARALNANTPTISGSSAGGAVAPGPPATPGGGSTVTTPTTATAPAEATGAPAATTTGPTPTVSIPAPSSPAAQGNTAAVPALRSTHPVKGSGKISDAALTAAILAGLIALACLVWGVFRLRAFEPHWLLSLRHSLAEGGFRASATWAEFSDWIRLGR